MNFKRKSYVKLSILLAVLVIWHIPLWPCLKNLLPVKPKLDTVLRDIKYRNSPPIGENLGDGWATSRKKLSLDFEPPESLYRDFFQFNKKYPTLQVSRTREYINPVKAIIDQYNWTGGFKTELDLLRKPYVDSIPTITSSFNITSHIMKKVRLPPIPPLPDVDCAKLFSNDPEEMIRTELLEQQMVAKDFYQEHLDTGLCEVLMVERGYVTTPVTKEEEDFPLAYSIMMYKTVGQVERLLRAIYRPQNYYCIHIDRKTKPETHWSMAHLAACFNNVFIASRSLEVTWGEMSVIEAELVCMKDLWNESMKGRKKWKYFINLTGQEFPLKTNWEIVQILKSYKGANDVGATISSHWDFRRECVYNIHGKKPTCLKKKSPQPHPYRFAKGPVHVAVSRQFVDFCLHDQIAIDLFKWLNGTLIPDETFFQTLFLSHNLNVPGAYLGAPCEDRREVHPMVRFKKWDWWRPCRGDMQRHICLMTIWDLPELAVRPEMFVNKFEIKRHPLAYACLEQLHINKTREDIMLAAAAAKDTKRVVKGFVLEKNLYHKIPWITKSNIN